MQIINNKTKKIIQDAGELIHEINSMDIPAPEPDFKLISPEDTWEVLQDMPESWDAHRLDR